MPNKQITDDNYRYAFQGQEKDGETGMEAFELRLWDGRLGRWLSPDPYNEFFSPYLGMANSPLMAIDDPNKKIETWLTNGLQSSPYYVSLAHELAHLYGKIHGRGSRAFWTKVGGKPITLHEQFASLVENKIRLEHGLNLRTHYSHETYDDGTAAPLPSTKLFEMKNQLNYLNSAENFFKFQFSILNFRSNYEFQNVSTSPRYF